MFRTIATYNGKNRIYSVIVLDHTSAGVIYQIDGTDIGGNYTSVADAVKAIEDFDNAFEPLDLTARV